MYHGLTHCRFSPTVTIEANKDGVKFSCNGDIGNGAVTLRSHQDIEKEENNIDIELSEPVSLTFSLKYLVNFCKAQALSGKVKICLSNEVPLLVEYGLAGSSYLRFYLAPKVCVPVYPFTLDRYKFLSTSLLLRPSLLINPERCRSETTSKSTTAYGIRKDEHDAQERGGRRHHATRVQGCVRAGYAAALLQYADSLHGCVGYSV